jgi:iron complex transport system substrate-binding protein
MISRGHSTPSFRAAARSVVPLDPAGHPAVPLPWLLLAGLFLSACDAPAARAPAADRTAGAASSVVVVEDPTGRPVSLDGPARRVVSMMPAITEWIIAMDAAGRLVARTDYDRHPALDTLPSVGGGLTPSVEWLAARRPDLVIAWPDAPSRSIVARLEQVGIPVYTAPIESIEESLAVAADVGRLLGEANAADRAITGVRAGLDSIRAAVEGHPTPTVLYLIGLDPLTAAGPGTFIDELIRVAGGRNALSDLRIRWPQISLEEVVRRSPDVVIVASVGTRDPATILASQPGWRDVPAVRDGAVHALDPDSANRPGPHMARAAATLAALIHPELDTRRATGDPPR